ncbi:MAG: hypothetical protein JSV86_16915 [Gemmatimonadota bacterium]|nr:MAG: hypothetical protein JSV86_16915 [Gemmatimonadota bacterium]
MRGRAERRAFAAKAKARIRRQRPDLADSPRFVGLLAKTPQPCSSACCGGRRRSEGATPRERLDDVAEQFDDLHEECWDVRNAVDEATNWVDMQLDYYHHLYDVRSPKCGRDDYVPSADVDLDELREIAALHYAAYPLATAGDAWGAPPKEMGAHYQGEATGTPGWVLSAYGLYVTCPHCRERTTIEYPDGWTAIECPHCEAPLAIWSTRCVPLTGATTIAWAFVPRAWIRRVTAAIRSNKRLSRTRQPTYECRCVYHVDPAHLSARMSASPYWRYDPYIS